MVEASDELEVVSSDDLQKNESRCFITKNPTDLKMHEC